MVSFDITQCHELTVPKLSQRVAASAVSFGPAAGSEVRVLELLGYDPTCRNEVCNDALVDVEVSLVLAQIANLMTLIEDAPDSGPSPNVCGNT